MVHPPPCQPCALTSSRGYLVHRLRETHDIVHVLTGFSIHGIGELGLLAFNLAQVRSPLAAMLIFGGLLKALSQEFEMGMAAQCLIAYRLEDHWARPLGEWRRELGLPD